MVHNPKKEERKWGGGCLKALMEMSLICNLRKQNPGCALELMGLDNARIKPSFQVAFRAAVTKGERK